MNKSIAKEIIIGLLLCLAILLILSVLLYSYIPNNKVVPELVAYSTPEDAKEVLKEAQVDTSKVILTYEVNGNELTTAQKTNSYKAGKVNPFSTYKPTNTTEGTTGSSASSSTTSQGTGNGGNSSAGTPSDESSSSAGTSSNNGAGSNAGTSSSGGASSSSNSSSNGGTYYKNKGTK